MTNFLRVTYDQNDPAIASVVDECSLWAARFGLFLFSHLELRPNLRILDLACGTGFPLFELAHMYGPTCHVTGVDNWKAAIERARSKLRTYQHPNVQIIEADAAHLPFEDDVFDVIVSNLGVNNFVDPQAVFGECFRVARPGAHLALTTNPIGHMHEFYEVFHQTLLGLQKPDYLERLQAHEAHRGTKESLSDMFQAAGFRVVKIREDRFHLRYLDGNAFFNHFLTQFGFLDGWRRVIDQEDEERVFALLTNKLTQLASASGELRMTVPMLYMEGEKPV
ncbi:MAG TPA: methyltransferase domain-containing protein [Ktedonobacteraceae bacterium]|nr:methyltransferase domain-containing protein [Ktedonobacteraceae bacterium]